MENHGKKLSGARFLLYPRLPVMGGQYSGGRALPYTQIDNLLHILYPLLIGDRSSR